MVARCFYWSIWIQMAQRIISGDKYEVERPRQGRWRLLPPSSPSSFSSFSSLSSLSSPSSPSSFSRFFWIFRAQRKISGGKYEVERLRQGQRPCCGLRPHRPHLLSGEPILGVSPKRRTAKQLINNHLAVLLVIPTGFKPVTF